MSDYNRIKWERERRENKTQTENWSPNRTHAAKPEEERHE